MASEDKVFLDSDVVLDHLADRQPVSELSSVGTTLRHFVNLDERDPSGVADSSDLHGAG